MPAYKDPKGKWYVSVYYDNWQGIRTRKLKRGFATRKEALEWERIFLMKGKGDLDMSFGAFVELYKTDLKDRIKLNTWIMKDSVIDQKILPYFKDKKMNDIIKKNIPGIKTFAKTNAKHKKVKIIGLFFIFLLR